MFRRQGIGAGNQECAARGGAIVASARLVAGKVNPLPKSLGISSLTVERRGGRGNARRVELFQQWLGIHRVAQRQI